MTIDEYLELVERIRDGLRKEIDEGWVEVQLHPNGGQWCSDEALLRMKEYALAHGMYIHLHLLETQYQAEYARRTWGKSFIQHYQDIGFLGPWVSFAHAVWLDEEDLQLIAASGAHLVTNPSSNLRLRSGAFNMRRACELGLATILTSGQAADAWSGRAMLARLQQQAAGRIEILAGAGVNARNIPDLVRQTHVTACHLSGKKRVPSRMVFRRAGVPMGLPGFDEFELWQTDPAAIRAARAALDGVHD